MTLIEKRKLRNVDIQPVIANLLSNVGRSYKFQLTEDGIVVTPDLDKDTLKTIRAAIKDIDDTKDLKSRINDNDVNKWLSMSDADLAVWFKDNATAANLPTILTNMIQVMRPVVVYLGGSQKNATVQYIPKSRKKSGFLRRIIERFL